MPGIRFKPGGYIAAVDMGTNSFHMIIAQLLETGSFKVVDRLKHWVRLGDGMDRRGRLDEEAVERMLDSLRQFKQLAGGYNAPLCCIATSALRDAPNRASILNRLLLELDVHVDVVSGQEEARLIFQGVRSEGHVSDKPIRIIDIGGGSTEVMAGNNSGLMVAESMDMGARRYARMFFADKKYRQSDIDRCQHAAAMKIQSVSSEYEEWEKAPGIGTSGTIRALATLNAEWREGDDDSRLKLKHLRTLLPRLVECCCKQTGLENMEPERRDTIVAGAIILIEVMSALGMKSLNICLSALREGIVFDRVEAHGELPVQPMQAAVKSMARRFAVDRVQSARVMQTSRHIFNTYAEQLELDEEAAELLDEACTLHEVGLGVCHKRMQLHGGYLITHADLTGITQRQQQMLAAIVRFHRKQKPSQKSVELKGLHPFDVQSVVRLAAILRLAAALNRTKSGPAAMPEISRYRRGWQWRFKAKWAARHEVCIWNSDEEKQPLSKQLGVSIYLMSEG